MKQLLHVGIAAVALTAAMPASAAVFDIATTTSGKTATSGYGNVFTYDVTSGANKLTMQASGWNVSYQNGNWIANTAEIVSFGTAGLGVQSRNETQAQLNDGHHQIDNNNGYEYVMLQFSEAVSLSSIGINSYGMKDIGKDNDLGIFTSSATSFFNGMTWSAVGNGQNYTSSNGDGSNGTRTFDLTNVKSNVWMISSSLTDTSGNDAFKLTAMRVVTAVPEPTTWAMMLVGFGMVGAAARYRRRSTAAAIA